MQLDFTDKELQMIQILNPGVEPTATVTAVVRNWLAISTNRYHGQLKTMPEQIDEVITAVNIAKIKKNDVIK